VGLGVAAILFSLSHLPNRWVKEDEHGGLLVADLAWLVLSGLMFTFMYIRTGHLEVAIGFHALWNVPLPVIAAPLVDHGAIFAVTVVLLIVWPYAEVRVRGHIHL
jgi:membrane protease YdiL (CAAX protease family)